MREDRKVKHEKPRHPHSSVSVSVDQGGPSLTHQSFKEASDVKNIIATYSRTGFLPPSRAAAQYADVSGLSGDLTDKLNLHHDVMGKVAGYKPPVPANDIGQQQPSGSSDPAP